uniref:Multifunctional fusion protein n=1 Tax=Schlesneria paludicola TaxID=360056 RepID=A0A7C2JZK5_9PLAN
MWLSGLLAQADAASPAAQADSGSGAGWQFFLIAGLVFVLPFVVGQLLGQALKLKEFGFKIGVVLFSIALATAPFIYNAIMPQHSWTDAIALGIDLAGGTNLIYAVDREQAAKDGKAVDSATLDKMVGAVGRRINPSGAEEVTVRRVGDDRIEVIIPGADRELVEQKKRQIVNLGSLEFAILANDKDHRRQIEAARKLRDDQDNLLEGGRVAASWRNVAPGEDVNQIPGDRTAVREVERTVDGKPVKVRQFLVIHEPPEREVTGKYLTRTAPTMDDTGQLAVSFTFNATGANRFSVLTGRYQPDKSDGFERRLAVLLNGDIQTAPNLKSRIGASGQISGNFTREEIDELINVLNAGALEVPLITEPVSEFTISPTLGVDVQTKGITSIVVSAIVVFAFMLIYYRTAGLIADLCLLLNLVLVVGAMAFIEATFTLPGLAGLVLTIGMAIDSNVLINERIREELARGSSLRMAIENGFDKALSSIVDGNVTSLITAVILYMIGSDQIRGFAVSLFIGLTMSLFSVLYFGHLLMQILEKKRWVRTFRMMQFIGKTRVDFLSQRRWAFALSGVFIVAGMAALFARGEQNMDIDFSGGTMVTFEFVDSQKTADVQARLEEKFGSTVSLERLVLPSEAADLSSGHRFRMRTTEQEQGSVAQKISEVFSGAGMALVQAKMEFEPVQPITGEDDTRFAGGHQAALKFTAGMGTATTAGSLADALKQIKTENGQPKYDAADSLIEVVGTTEAASTESSATSQKYTGMTARAVAAVSADDLSEALKIMQAELAARPAFEELNSFDTSVALDTQISALLAILASFVAIVAYIWFRFEKVYYGVGALVAVAHDVLVTLSAIVLGAYLSKTPIGELLLLDDFKINLALVASLLTIVGYSLNDTIVIFDRIREIKGKNPHVTPEIVNLSVNETLSRTIMTAWTTLVVVLILYIFGGDGIHGFAYANIIGTIAGCYSTIFIANPVMLWFARREEAAGRGLARPISQIPAATGR